ncbi:unnamed protein product [Effrenium voratum]|nr:unnamed protein product [Effrenium voratum]
MGNCGCFSFLKELPSPPQDKPKLPDLAGSSPPKEPRDASGKGTEKPSEAEAEGPGDDFSQWQPGKHGVADISPNQDGRLLIREPPKLPKDAAAVPDGAEVCLNLEILAGGKRMMRCEALRTSAGSGDLNLPEELELVIPCLKPGGVFTALCRPFGLGELPATGLWQSLVACYGKEAVLKLELLEVQDLCLATLEGHERLDYAKGRKEAAGRFFKRQRFEAALERYSLAAEMLTQRDDIKDNALYSQAQEVKSLCELNAAACLLKLEKWRDAEAVCNAILRANPANEKALFRRGKALLALGDSARASADLRKVLEVNPNNSEAKQLLQQAKKESKGTARERNVYAKMLQSD